MHNIETTAKGASFAGRIPAWHKLGTIWPEGTTTADAIHLANADYSVFTAPIYASVNEQQAEVPGKLATYRVRDDEIVPLGIVSPRYRVCQNTEAFMFGDDLVFGGAVPDAVGVLGNGEKAFMTFKLEHMELGGQEAFDLNLVVLNSHDGSIPVSYLVTPVRVVCQNTLWLSMTNFKTKYTIRHLSNLRGSRDEAMRALALTHKYAAMFAEQVEKLIDTPASIDQFLAEMFPVVGPKLTKTGITLNENYQQSVADVYNSPTQDGIRGTAWGVFNAYAEWHDHYRQMGRKMKNADQGVILGDTDGAKQRALALVVSQNR